MSNQKHYDNTNGSLYQFCDQKGLNSYEFDIIKRVMRCRKKGNFLEDLEKTKFLIDLYIKENQKEIRDDSVYQVNDAVSVTKRISEMPERLRAQMGVITPNIKITYPAK
jgi:hypothetical protein